MSIFAKILFSSIILVYVSILSAADSSDLRTEHFSNLKARNIGPAIMSGRITDIAADPQDSNIIYVGTAGGGIWKSEDNGVTFSSVFDNYCQSIGALAIDPQNPKRIWAGSGEANVRNSVGMGDGIYFSADGCKNWIKKGLEKSERIARIIVDPRNSERIYVAVLGELFRDSEERGIFLSEDGGKSWKKILYINSRTGCADLEIDPKNPDVIYAAMWEFRRWPWFFYSGGKNSGLYKSIDRGKSFFQINNGLPQEPLGRIAIALSASNPQIIYLLVEAENQGGLYYSADAGKNFKLINDSQAVRNRPFYFSNLVVDPNNDQTIYVAGTILAKSTDGGKSFSTLTYSGLNYHPDIHPIWINPKNSRHVILGTDGGIYISYNGARTFNFLRNLPVSQFYHVSTDNRSPYWVYGGLQDNGCWMGPSASERGKITNHDWINVSGADGFYCIPHPLNHNLIYYSWQGGNLLLLDMEKKQIRDIKPFPQKNDPPFRFNWNAAFAVSQHAPNTIYFGAQFLFKSEDLGENWKKISPDLTTNNREKQKQKESGGLTRDVTGAENYCSLYTIAESPINKDIIWTGSDDGVISLTVDGGKNWKNISKNIKDLPQDSWCSHIEAGRFNEAESFVVFDNHRTGDRNPYIFYTADFGKTWTNLATSQIKHYCLVIRQDFKNPDLLYLGTNGGLYISFDKGRNWIWLSQTLPAAEIFDLAFHQRENDLIIGTHGRGIWILDDLSGLQAISGNILKDEITLLPSRTAVEPLSLPLQEFPGNSEFSAANPPEGMLISYFLQKRHIIGEFKIEIYDQQDNFLVSLPTAKSAGFNRLVWNLRLPAPKIGPHIADQYMILQGQMVTPKEYKIRISKGNQIIESRQKLLASEKLGFSAQERELQFQTAKKLSSMIESCGYMVAVLERLRLQAEKIINQLPAKETNLKNNLKSYIIYLKELFKNLTAGGNKYAEERVREKIINLYQIIESFRGKPSDAQLKYLDLLEKELKNYRYAFGNLAEKRLNYLNQILSAKNLPLLNSLSFEEYLKEN